MRIAYIGAGVSTIFGVLTLLKRGFEGKNITIFEKGNSIENRNPEEVLFGAGGAGTYSDGKFVFNLELGGQLSKYTGKEKALELFEKVKELLIEFHPDKDKIYKSYPGNVPQEVLDVGLDMRLSEVWHVGTDYLEQWVRNIFNYFKQHGVNVLYNTEVYSIDFYNNLVLYDKLNAKTCFTRDQDKFDKIIVATGKGGIQLVQELIDRYILETDPKALQIGGRFESKSKYFDKLTGESYDLKLYRRYDNYTSVRTFCTNRQNSYIAIEEYNNGLIKTVNGHSFRENKENDIINFGIMVEVKYRTKDVLKYSQEWAEKFNLDSHIVVYRGNTNYIPSIFKENIIKQSVVVVDKEFLLKISNYKDIPTIFHFIDNLNNLFHFEDDFCIYFPEVKFLTDEVRVNYNDLSILRYPDIYLNGDSLSARGIVVSASQGIYTAENLKI